MATKDGKFQETLGWTFTEKTRWIVEELQKYEEPYPHDRTWKEVGRIVFDERIDLLKAGWRPLDKDVLFLFKAILQLDHRGIEAIEKIIGKARSKSGGRIDYTPIQLPLPSEQ